MAKNSTYAFDLEKLPRAGANRGSSPRAKARQDPDGRIIVPLPWTRPEPRHTGVCAAPRPHSSTTSCDSAATAEPQPLFIYDARALLVGQLEACHGWPYLRSNRSRWPNGGRHGGAGTSPLGASKPDRYYRRRITKQWAVRGRKAGYK